MFTPYRTAASLTPRRNTAVARRTRRAARARARRTNYELEAGYALLLGLAGFVLIAGGAAVLGNL